MKFSQLATGTVFRYRDKDYRKISPLQAVPEPPGTGESRRKLIPRSAVVQLLDNAGAPVASTLPDTIPAPRLSALLDDLYGSKLQAALRRVDPPLSETQLVRVTQLIDKAREQLVAGLVLDRTKHEDA